MNKEKRDRERAADFAAIFLPGLIKQRGLDVDRDDGIVQRLAASIARECSAEQIADLQSLDDERNYQFMLALYSLCRDRAASISIPRNVIN